MYYSEKIINGVLCWRTSPDDEYTPFTLEELTQINQRKDLELRNIKSKLEEIIKE